MIEAYKACHWFKQVHGSSANKAMMYDMILNNDKQFIYQNYDRNYWMGIDVKATIYLYWISYHLI